MKYVRFQGLELNCGTSNKRGIFQLAYELKHASSTAHYDDQQLRKNLTWLETHLQVPSVLEKGTHYRAICWFKDAAHEPLKRIWAIKFLLQEYGRTVDLIATRKPGYILYEDGWQIVAQPFRDVAQR